MRTRLLALALALATVSVPGNARLLADGQAAAPTRKPDVIYVPTPQPVVEAMLQVAGVGKDDIVYDLGCGDGRLPITAAKKYGAHGVCIDIDPVRIAEIKANVEKEKVGDSVKVIEGDLFQLDLSPATVVTLYLLPSLNIRLMPKLVKELRPGTRVVSHRFDMGDWKPLKELDVEGSKVFYWVIPKQ
jgi:tRNA G37 N-methylase Trm5